MDQLEHNLINPSNVELLNKFVELTVVDANEAERDAVNIAERKLFLQRQMNYKPIKFFFFVYLTSNKITFHFN